MGPFDATAHAERVRRVQEEMAARGYDALVVVDPANLYYLCGYDAWSFYMPQGLLVPADGRPHLVARAMDAQGAHHTATLPGEHVHGYPEDLVHRPDVHPWDWIAARGREVGVLPERGRVAAELDAHYFSPRGHLALAAALPGVQVVDSAELVNWVRLVKSPAEQQLMREAARITTRAMRLALDGLADGVRQCDLVAQIQHAQATGVDGFGGDYPALVPLLPTGESAGTPHLTWSDEPLRAGEATTIELAGVRHRYHAPLARTVSLGPPPPRLAACADAVAEGREAALDAFHPGATGADVHAGFAAAIARHGLSKASRVGYSIGIGYPPDWGERTVSLRAAETTELLPGMCFHLILGMWMDGWGYETSESVLVTETGPELLTDIDPGLVVKR
ncbi:M24 family metallopeptidase [Nocardioides rotundus]|uniref:M24 family metallopeptidase n=1 Tax=Nocardioides rotundus TaxID=1774216 RepID=UPI001CBDC1BC|nr:M24 family metallopeptidase [Nocardioides rotundus]UAL30851.1 M24 family metallopeptidase [Nocardioides rotundus]